MKKLTGKILDAIEKQHIHPRPRWQFVLTDISVWMFLVLTIVFGGLAFSIMLYAIAETDFSLISHLGRSTLETLLFLTPLLWLCCFLLFLVGSFFFWKRTKRGYRIPLFSFALVTLIASNVLGTAWFLTGGGQVLDEVFGGHIPGYRSVRLQRMMVWSRPEEGMLAGKVTAVGEDSLTVTDFDGEEWQVDYDDDFIEPPFGEPFTGMTVRLQGKVAGDHRFVAEAIMPWHRRRTPPWVMMEPPYPEDHHQMRGNRMRVPMRDDESRITNDE